MQASSSLPKNTRQYVLIFLHLGKILHLSKQKQVSKSHLTSTALGEDATLQCLLRPPQDATNMTVEWRHGYLNLTVHLYEDRNTPAEQKEHSEGRTSLFREGLTKGNLSLKLSTVALSDAGRYRCSIHTDKLQKSCYVTLTVGRYTEDQVILTFLFYLLKQQTASKYVPPPDSIDKPSHFT
uniref:Ig-like domain-containing protein n=1 Tax=Dicentrarchus labrax TaxID=13489 RepID=A0A8P4KRW3_DICLA